MDTLSKDIILSVLPNYLNTRSLVRFSQCNKRIHNILGDKCKILKNKWTALNKEKAMILSIIEGDKEMLVWSLSKQGITEYNKGLTYSAGCGNMEFVKFFLENGATEYRSATDAMNAAALEGHIDIVEYLIFRCGNTRNWDGIIGHAIMGRHWDLVNICLSNGADFPECQRNEVESIFGVDLSNLLIE
jgi:hypothetical protein